MAENKRQARRIDFHTRARLIFDGNDIKGRVENLSLKGMFFVPEKEVGGLMAGKKLEIVLSLTGTGSELSFQVEGEVVRVDEEGVALHFTKIEFDSFLHLRNIVAYNTGDEEGIMEEYNKVLRGDE